MQKRIFALVLILLLAAACNGVPGATQGSGKIVSENRPISGVTAVTLSTSGNLTISQGQTESLTIESDDNILPLLTSDVANGVLTLGTKPNTAINASRIQYTLTVTDLNTLITTGSGDITAGEFTNDNFRLETNGSGDVAMEGLTGLNPTVILTASGTVTIRYLDAQNLTLTQSGSGGATLVGRAQNQTVTISGSGDYDGQGLQSQTASIEMSSSGDATVNVSETLNVNLSGSGNLNYSGDATLNENVSGSGKVQKQG